MVETGVEEEQPWLRTDTAKKPCYADKFKKGNRLDVMLRNILKRQLAGELEAAALRTILCLRSLCQCKNDDGSGRIAWKLSYLKDPIYETRFSGTEKYLERIANHEKALAERRRKNNEGFGKGKKGKGEDKNAEKN